MGLGHVADKYPAALSGNVLILPRDSEMISGQFGVGYYTWEAYTLQNYADIIVGMLVIGALGLASSALIRRIGRALTPWQIPK